jgi:hypothetical protein
MPPWRVAGQLYFFFFLLLWAYVFTEMLFRVEMSVSALVAAGIFLLFVCFETPTWGFGLPI